MNVCLGCAGTDLYHASGKRVVAASAASASGTSGPRIRRFQLEIMSWRGSCSSLGVCSSTFFFLFRLKPDTSGENKGRVSYGLRPRQTHFGKGRKTTSLVFSRHDRWRGKRRRERNGRIQKSFSGAAPRKKTRRIATVYRTQMALFLRSLLFSIRFTPVPKRECLTPILLVCFSVPFEDCKGKSLLPSSAPLALCCCSVHKSIKKKRPAKHHVFSLVLVCAVKKKCKFGPLFYLFLFFFLSAFFFLFTSPSW